VLAAVQTGRWAGEALLRAREDGGFARALAWHRRRCASFYRRQLATGMIFRRLLDLGWAETLAGVVPGALLFQLTRPAVRMKVER
jgi:flavin-dependent dehydrogenase